MLNPVWLNTFKELVETGHFTETARKLFMTQPGVSQHLKKLEAYCGHTLIIRDNKHLNLTDYGRLVYSYAIDSIENEALLLESLRIDSPFSGRFTFACSGSLSLLLYPQMLKLQEKHQKLHIHLEVSPNRKILDGIEAGDFDYGIATDKPNERLFKCEKLGYEEICLIIPNRIEHIDATEDLDDLLMSLGLINHPDACQYLSLYFSQCGIKDLAAINIKKMPISGYVNQLVQILIPVSKGLGFTVLPRSALDHFPDNDLLHVIKPPKLVKEPLIGISSRYRPLPSRCEAVISYLNSMISHL